MARGVKTVATTRKPAASKPAASKPKPAASKRTTTTPKIPRGTRAGSGPKPATYNVNLAKARWVQWGHSMIHLHEAPNNERIAGTMALCGVPAPMDVVGNKVVDPANVRHVNDVSVCQFCARIATRAIANGDKVPPLPKPPKGSKYNFGAFPLPVSKR